MDALIYILIAFIAAGVLLLFFEIIYLIHPFKCLVRFYHGIFCEEGQHSDAIAPGLNICSYPGGQYSRVFGIIEFDDRIERVDPSKIQFVDEIHSYLKKENN